MERLERPNVLSLWGSRTMGWLCMKATASSAPSTRVTISSYWSCFALAFTTSNIEGLSPIYCECVAVCNGILADRRCDEKVSGLPEGEEAPPVGRFTRDRSTTVRYSVGWRDLLKIGR